MNQRKLQELSQLSMLDLFRVEAESQTAILTSGLLDLERGAGRPEQLETLMRAAHSLKGAARIMNLEQTVRVAHAMEDRFVAAQKGQLLSKNEIDVLLRGADLFLQISRQTDPGTWEKDHASEVQGAIESLTRLIAAEEPAANLSAPQRTGSQVSAATSPLQPEAPPEIRQDNASARQPTSERVVRLTAENLNRLLGLAGESLVESRWLRPFAESLQRLKRQQADLAHGLDELRNRLARSQPPVHAQAQLDDLIGKVGACEHFLSARIEELDLFDRRSSHLSHRLYLEVLRTRMRPFSDGVRRFPRMVRDLARSLGKEIRLEILGENTQLDRDILDRLETPLAHLLRNAVDHGCESPEQRRAGGKPQEALIRIEARHSAGMLQITITDDGAGVDPERIRTAIVEKQLAVPGTAEKLSEAELLEFLFLPGFTMKETVTEISGRGVGLDVVQNMVKSVRGAIRVSTQPGRGLRMQLHLPLTLSVLRALLVDVAGEPYAIPLTQINRTVKLTRDQIQTVEGRHHFQFDQQQVGLLTAHQVLDCGEARPNGRDFPVVVIGDRNTRYGLVVDRFLGERELVVQPLDPRLGKIQDISTAALMEDGSPVLIIDVEDLVRSIEKLIVANQLAPVQGNSLALGAKKQKRVLAVDDSLTVRELERKLLINRGYLADVAVDGMDGWNAVRSGHYDLVLTDIDMPRMDGIELAALIKNDPHLKSLPVMIVTYKDHEEDRLRGMEAGADYYLSKGSFHDETLLNAVVDLIGEPDS